MRSTFMLFSVIAYHAEDETKNKTYENGEDVTLLPSGNIVRGDCALIS